VIDDENLDNCATRASEALLNFQKQEKECADGDKDESEEEDDEDEKKRMKRLGDLIGASASLCVAIRRLVDLQVQLDVDATTHNLTCAWEAAAKVTHNEIDGRMLDLTTRTNWKKPFLKLQTPATGLGPGILDLGVSGRQRCMCSIPRLVTLPTVLWSKTAITTKLHRRSVCSTKTTAFGLRTVTEREFRWKWLRCMICVRSRALDMLSRSSTGAWVRTDDVCSACISR
jgi:hypothetical protein